MSTSMADPAFLSILGFVSATAIDRTFCLDRVDLWKRQPPPKVHRATHRPERAWYPGPQPRNQS